MLSLSAARAAAYERCAKHLECRVGVDANETLADAWVARKLRAEASVWRQLSESQPLVHDPLDSNQREAAPARKVGKPLTDRMVETLVEMKRGTKVESDEFFSWPRWQFQPSIKGRLRTSLGCPTRAMLEGLHERGLLMVSRNGRQWVIEINDAGRDALLAHERAKNAKKPSPFKRYSISYCVKQLGDMRTSLQPVTARTEAEALAKLKKELQRRNSSYEYSDFRVEWVGANGR
jgi:hypothetical protein